MCVRISVYIIAITKTRRNIRVPFFLLYPRSTTAARRLSPSRTSLSSDHRTQHGAHSTCAPLYINNNSISLAHTRRIDANITEALARGDTVHTLLFSLNTNSIYTRGGYDGIMQTVRAHSRRRFDTRSISRDITLSLSLFPVLSLFHPRNTHTLAHTWRCLNVFPVCMTVEGQIKNTPRSLPFTERRRRRRSSSI